MLLKIMMIMKVNEMRVVINSQSVIFLEFFLFSREKKEHKNGIFFLECGAKEFFS